MSYTDFLSAYDADVARAIVAAHETMSGLPEYLGIDILDLQPGTVAARARLSETLLTPSGNVHGGALAAILDHITGVVVYPLIPAGSWGATTDLKINYMRPVKPGDIAAEAHVVGMTGRTAVVRGELRSDNRVACAAQGTITIVHPAGRAA